MQNRNFEIQNNINRISNINHISQQKSVNITKELVKFSQEASDKLLRHNPAATTEWDNSVYSFVNGESQVSAVIDQSTYDLIRLFFNSRPKNIDSNKSTIFKHRSILKTFIGRPRVKSSLNRARITIYKYNRQKVYYMNMLNKSFRLCSNIKRKKGVKSTEKKLITSLNPSIESFDSFKLKNTTKKGKRTFSYLSQKGVKSSVKNNNGLGPSLESIGKNIVNLNNKRAKKNKNYNKRVSSWILRKLTEKLQMGKKRIFFNILRNKTFQLVWSTLKSSFKSKPSILVLKKIENYSMKFYFKVRSLKLFLFNYANNETYSRTPHFILTIWKKWRNSRISPISTLPLTKKGAKHVSKNLLLCKYSKQKANHNKIVIPTLRLGKLVGKLYKRIFASKFYYTILWVYYMKSNNLYLSRLNHILKKRYGKKITLNIVDLKYIYLDSNIMAEAITTKLKDRKKRVLRVLKRALGLIKKPYFKIHFYNKKKTLEQLNVNFLLMDKKLNMSTYTISNNIILNKYLFKKPTNYKSRLLLFHLKHKIISGVRLEGSGRLTRRLTASRSISKFKYMGSLQNIESSRQALSTVMLRGYMKSNLQYMNINSYNRNGAFGVKVSVSSY
jgi:hypothetical protein